MGDCTSKKQSKASGLEDSYGRYSNQLLTYSPKKSIFMITKQEEANLFPEEVKQNRKYYHQQIKNSQKAICKNTQQVVTSKMAEENFPSKIYEFDHKINVCSPQKEKDEFRIATQKNSGQYEQQLKRLQQNEIKIMKYESDLQNFPNRKMLPSEQSSEAISSKHQTSSQSKVYIAGLEIISEASLETSLRKENFRQDWNHEPYLYNMNNPFYLHSEMVKTEQNYDYGPSTATLFQWQQTI